MLEREDFKYKHIIFVFSSEGDSVHFANENLVVRNKDNEIKIQVSCYNIFSIFIVGDTSITTPFIKKIADYHISIVLCSQSFRVYQVICNQNSGNVELRKKQYAYQSNEIAKKIIANKIQNQIYVLKKTRMHDGMFKSEISRISECISGLNEANETREIMGIEGLASKIYFSLLFTNCEWNGRWPRIKKDYINCCLDMGYTILFNFIDSLLELYGFDVFVGVHHKEFYMRKSLVCDIIEPFRSIIDYQTRKSIGLKQIKESDFDIVNHQYRLKWSKGKDYTRLYLNAIIEYKEEIFIFIQKYYRFFMRKKSVSQFHMFLMEEL